MENKNTIITINVKAETQFSAYKIAHLAFDFLGDGYDSEAVKLHSGNSTITFSLDFSADYRALTQFEAVADLFRSLEYYAEDVKEELKTA